MFLKHLIILAILLLSKKAKSMEASKHTIEVYYIRHGESEWNKDVGEDMRKPYGAALKHKMHGINTDLIKFGSDAALGLLKINKTDLTIPELDNKYEDSKLTKFGEDQAYLISQWFENEKKNLRKKFEFMFFTSPLQRAFKTLMIAAEPLGIKNSKVIIDPHMREPGSIDCRTPLFSGQMKHFEPGLIEPIVKPNVSYIQPLLESVLNEPFPDMQKFEFRDQFLKPSGKYKLSKILFEKIFLDMKTESLASRKNAAIIGGHSLFIKNGLASILSNKLTNIYKVKKETKKITNKLGFLFSKTKQKLKEKFKSAKENESEEEDLEDPQSNEQENDRKINIFTIWQEEWRRFATTKLDNGSVLNFSLTFHEDGSIEVGLPEIVFACPSELSEEYYI